MRATLSQSLPEFAGAYQPLHHRGQVHARHHGLTHATLTVTDNFKNQQAERLALRQGGN
jgi:hypothetical protein